MSTTSAADSDDKAVEKRGLKSFEEMPLMEYAVEQTQIFHRALESTVDSTVEVAKSRFYQFQSTSSAHLHQTLESLQDIKSEYNAYEDIFLGKIKDGIVVAASNPKTTFAAAFGLGVLGLKRPRHFLTNSISRVFVSEESLLSRADAKVKELRESVEFVKAESQKLEKKASQAEEELRRGRMKLRQAGNQIQGVIRSAYKIERQARGLKVIVGELPIREASRFRSQVSNLASAAKQERNALTKEVSRISNYGISI